MAPPIQPEPLVLASASPRRAKLLRDAGYRFQIVRPPLTEPPGNRRAAAPAALAEGLAYFKAMSVAVHSVKTIVLAADTLCAVGGQVVGKAADREDARRILRLLSGTRHEVITGVALLSAGGARRRLASAVTHVVFRPLAEEQVEQYLDSGEWQGKAGAYGIQDHGDTFVERIDGSFSNVVGLPLELVGELLAADVQSAAGAAGG